MFGRIKTRIRRGNSGQGSDSDSSMRSPSNQRKLRTAPAQSGLRTVDYHSKVEELAPFDSCVEACDALAASSHYATSSAKIDKETGLRDCSVLVSPDGDLLLVPQDPQDTRESSISEEEADASTEKKEDEDALSASLDFGDSEEYQCAVTMGNDLKPDKTINKFSAMGWSPTATSLALRQTAESLREMSSFVEALILSGKDTAARDSHACDQLRSAAGMAGRGNVPPMPLPERLRPPSGSGGKSKGSRWRSSNHESNGFEFDRISALEASPPLTPNAYNRESPTLELSSSRVGPIIYPGGTLHAATVALENYHSTMAENDSNRWRLASKSQASEVGVLPALRKASDQAAERAYRREKALKEMQNRAAMAEKDLQMRKEESKRCWDAVHRAEEQVTRIVEERMIERSRERERRRMELLQQEDEKRRAENADLGATPGEIWDIVSAVAESMDDGSFTPVGVPQAPVAGPTDKSQKEQENDQVDSTATSDPTTPRPRPPSPSLPMASRTEIEHECRLPELRRAAMEADESIEDAAQTLLNILSTLDTTRRSARVAAETCLLSAGHAQAACIRSLIALERASIEDRLKNIVDLERVAEKMDVRSDLDAYIEADKKERGGSTWMGDDDDGGVASALAILSSHVDGSMGMHTPSRVSTDGWDSPKEKGVTPEKLEEDVEYLFARNKLLLDNEEVGEEAEKAREQYESTVALLCSVAEDPAARSSRSAICYALNSKRSSNAEIPCKIQFEGICRVFLAILSGCDREAGGVANAKMCMMLAQTFYMIEQNDKDAAASSETSDGSPGNVCRSKRIFIKSRITEHPIWVDEEFWDHALYQCVTESLTNSGVMANFDSKGASNVNQSEWTENKKLKWHDLTQKERTEAASQVHAVVFAQLGALAHSMMEFGCGMEQACAFVRRMAIRNQLPISQRTMLLQHLTKRKSHA